jgi:hypothetical protein
MPNTTNVIGYFNPNDHPLQLSLAEFNMVLQLQPKAYIVDRTGRLVNDPHLDRFVGKGRLARASDQKQQVEIILLRPVNDTAAAPNAHQHSVSQATRFDTKDGRVIAVAPVNTAPQPPTPPPVSYNPVRGLTIEEAKRLRYIKPTRPVPEDFGADETAGAPKSGQEIPTIKYATDTVRGRKPAPLPAELAQPATPQQQAIIASLERAATSNPEDPNLLTQVSRTAIQEASQPLPPPIPIPAPLPPPVLDQTPRRLVPPPIPKNPVPTAATIFPPPVLDEAPESTMIVEEELTPTTTVPATQAEDRADAARHGSPPPELGAIACPKCSNKSFANRGLFLRHVRRFHSDAEAELMAPYPEA